MYFSMVINCRHTTTNTTIPALLRLRTFQKRDTKEDNHYQQDEMRCLNISLSNKE